MLRKCNQNIGKVKSKYWVHTHTFGVKIPKSVAEAKSFDDDNGNKLWLDAICKGTNNICLEFET